MVLIMASKLLLVAIFLVASCLAQQPHSALETNEVNDHYLTTTINFLFDLFLKHYEHKLIEEGKTRIYIGNLEKSFDGKILTVHLRGGISLMDGWASNVSTLHRTGDAEMDRINKDVVLSAHVGLAELQVDFSSYDVSLIGAHQRGKLHVSVGDNSVFLKINAQLEPCNVTLQEMTIEKMDDIRVDITNLGIFEDLTDEITSWVVNEISKWYRQHIESMVFPELAKVIKNIDICHYIPHH